MKKNLFLALMAVLVLAGCELQEQSQLTLDSITTKATITGTIMYDPGYDENGDALDLCPAAEQKVYVVIPYTEYDKNAVGEKMFEATIDPSGKFVLDIPMVSTTLSDVELNLRPFSADYMMYSSRGLKPSTAYFQMTAKKLTLVKGSVHDIDAAAGPIVLEYKTVVAK